MRSTEEDGGTRAETSPDTSGHDFPLGVSQPALRALHAAAYTRLDQLTTITERELLALHGMGPQALGVLREALRAQGKSFAAPESR